MLAYLLDENISPAIAAQVAAKDGRFTIHSVHEWRGGEFLGQTDARVVRAASAEQLTLVTYDVNTIPPLLQEFAADGETHASVLFIDSAVIRSNDFGGLVKALTAHWERHRDESWENRVALLTR
jgi:hypothetical protein